MSGCQKVARPIARSLRQERFIRNSSFGINRSFSQSPAVRDDTSTTTTAATPETGASSKPAEPEAPKPTGRVDRDPETVTNPWYEMKLVHKGTPPIGSRRRRAAIKTSENLPFEQLPYQAFQEARKVLQDDRNEKIVAIATELAKIKRLQETPGDQLPGGEKKKNTRIASLKRHVEQLKILADVNDPIVKKRFEDGLGE